MRRLLWIGDAGCDSGFAKATHHTLDTLRHSFQCHVLALNFNGDGNIQARFPFMLYPAWTPGNDVLGVKRTAKKIHDIRPHVVVIQNDPWHFAKYLHALEGYQESGGKIVGIVALDGMNMSREHAEDLNKLDVAIFWTEFAQREAQRAGFHKPSYVVGLGVNREIYKPGDKLEARKMLKLPDDLDNAFIIGNANRNQFRKRMDLLIRYFAKFKSQYQASDAVLYLHVAPTGDQGFDLLNLARYYDVAEDMILAEPEVTQGVPETYVAATLRAFDINATTTQGEGWGLTTLEAMACGTINVFPRYSALGEWAVQGGYAIPCSASCATLGTSVIGGVPDEREFVEALGKLYQREDLRELYREKALKVASWPQFQWSDVGAKVGHVLERALLGNQ